MRRYLFTAVAAALVAGCSGHVDMPGASNDMGDTGDMAQPGTTPGDAAMSSTEDLTQESTVDMTTAIAPTPDPCISGGTCPLGQWINVTPSNLDKKVLSPPTPSSSNSAFGPGAVVGDPTRPSDMYIAEGGAGLWKSTDYGNTWTEINSAIGYSPIGTPIAVAGTMPATLWLSDGMGQGNVLKSVDGGKTFATIPQKLGADLYSIRVDPYDATHLISGLHEADGIVESVDSGTTWKSVTQGVGSWPSGGISWFPFFVDTGSATTTRGKWFAIAQDGASAIMTANAGSTWSIPAGLSGLQHPHGNARLDQRGSTLMVAGIYGPGQGVYRSTDLGVHWTRSDSGTYPEAMVWSTAKTAYAMYGWACSGCSFGNDFETAAQPATMWTQASLPSGLSIGPNSIVLTNDGTHNIFVGAMWAAGIWKYIEP